MQPNTKGWRVNGGSALDDGGQSTESEAESSYQGWSDTWRGSSPDPRPSLSSSDEIRPDMTIPPAPAARGVSFSTGNGSMAHRRQTITRPNFHNVHSNMHLDELTPTVSNSHTVLTLGETLSPGSVSPNNGFGQPPPYPESGHTYTRSRRKSLSTATTAHNGPVLVIESEDSPDEKHPYPATFAPGSAHIKGKKKKRTTSFSLPFHRRRRLSNASWVGYMKWYKGSQRSVFRWSIVGLLAAMLFIGIYLWRRSYELQVELSFFSHKWVKEEFDVVMPLRGCFDPAHISPLYDMEKHLAPKHQALTPGVSLKRGTACYDFSSTVQPVPGAEPEHLLYHTYWRSDLIPFGERHMATLQSFLATQPLSHSKLILWTNGMDVISNSTFVKPIVEKWGDNIEVRQVDMTALTKSTELAGLLSNADGGGLYDKRAWVDGDAVRLLVLWHYGGVWMDMDQILTRDLHPLVEHEFVTQWDCYDKPYFSLNGALMHFRKHSPYLCEAFHIMATSPLPQPNTFTWGSHLYAKLHRRLLSARQKPFSVLPWCFADPRNCRSDIRFPDPFTPDPVSWAGRRWDGRGEVGRSGKELLEEKVGYVWTVHLHNQWRKDFPKGGWVDRLLEGYKGQIDAMERYIRSRGGQMGHGYTVRSMGEEEEEGGDGEGEGESEGEAEVVAHEEHKVVVDEEETRAEV